MLSLASVLLSTVPCFLWICSIDLLDVKRGLFPQPPSGPQQTVSL